MNHHDDEQNSTQYLIQSSRLTKYFFTRKKRVGTNTPSVEARNTIELVPVFEGDDEEHIAPSLDEPRSSSEDSSLLDLRRGGIDDFTYLMEKFFITKKFEILTHHFLFVVVFQYLFLVFLSNAADLLFFGNPS
jgi:hypothetical protein